MAWWGISGGESESLEFVHCTLAPRLTALPLESGPLCLLLAFQVSCHIQTQEPTWYLVRVPGLSQSHTPFNKNFPATPGVPLPDLVAGLSVAGLALVTILTVCLATVLLVRRWATGV